MNAMKKMIVVAAVAVAGFAAFAADEGAAAPSAEAYSFTYQACLRDEHGNPIMKDGVVQRNQNVILRLWNTATDGDSPLWARKYAVYTDETGLFNLEVSDSVGSEEPAQTNSLVVALTSANAGHLYIGLEVENSSGEIVPRQRLFAVPYAAVANDVRAITQDIPVAGRLSFAGSTGGKLVVSGDGIKQTGENSSEFSSVEAGLVQVGTIRSDGDTVTVDDNLKVTGKIYSEANKEEIVPVPVGGIIMWTKSELPEPKAHWAICDGQNGTPDLRGRFIVGVNDSTNPNGKNTAFSDYEVSKKGGEEVHKLTKDEMPNHNHTFASYEWVVDKITKESNEPDGTNRYFVKALYPDSDTVYRQAQDDNRPSGYSWYTENYTSAKTGGDKAHENRPPYYALYYIMRVE